MVVLTAGGKEVTGWRWRGVVWTAAVEWGRRWWQRVVASGVVDRADRVNGSVFGFRQKARRKSFPAAANDGSGDRHRLVAAENMGERA
nr:hypothetical protein [Tanacetum cinerariifolium]